MVHPLAVVLAGVARGDFPRADGVVEVVPPVPGNAAALLGFTGHFVLAADIDPIAVAERAPVGEFSIPMAPRFLEWVAATTGTRAGSLDQVFVAIASGPGAGTGSLAVERFEAPTHPRVERSLRHRFDVRLYATSDESGLVVLGRGLTRRWEMAFEVDDGARGRGVGRALARSALELLPAGTPVWAQVTPANAASVRALVAAGYTPVGSEVLFSAE